MFGAKRKRMMTDALKSTNNALDAIGSLTISLKAHDAIRGHIGTLQILDEQEQDNISLIVAHMMIARENMMLAMGRSHFFGIRSLYAPTEPDDAAEFAEKVKKEMFG